MQTIVPYRPVWRAPNVAPARPGDQILVTMPHYWGKGINLSEAVERLKQAGGRPRQYWRIHSVHPDTSVNGLGQIEYPTDHPPVMIAESNPA